MQKVHSKNQGMIKPFHRRTPLTALAVAAICALYAHYFEMTNGLVFIFISGLTWAALSFTTFLIFVWFGTKDLADKNQFSLAVLWFLIRGFLFLSILICCFSGVWSYGSGYMTQIILCGILDTVFILYIMSDHTKT